MKKIRFKQHLGDPGRLPTNKEHYNFKWLETGCDVLFSVCRQGNGASCHFTSDKAGMKKIKQGINEFVDFVFWMFPWCDMIIAKIRLKKVKSIVKKCGFKKALKSNTNLSIYVRKRSWAIS
jgi:hypothetical protein